MTGHATAPEALPRAPAEGQQAPAPGVECSPLELATGILLGSASSPAPLPDPGGDSPLRALEREMLPGLLRPPCLVSFSGGRDSSAVLAVAAALARRKGLAAPIPVTNVFPAAPDTNESEWQECVIRHLGLAEWIRIEHTDELDVVGPYAQQVLRRHGLLWPCNVHFHVPLLAAAQGGSLFTGVGGDELFAASLASEGTSRGATSWVAPRRWLRLGFRHAPSVVRRKVLAHRTPVRLPWLRPGARRTATAALAAEYEREPRSLEKRLAWWQTLRYLEVGCAALKLVAADADVAISHPLLGPRFWSAVAREATPHGYRSRTEGMRQVFGALLPPELLARRSKAKFNAVFWVAHARAFAGSWNGTGVPAELVDVEALARHWNGDAPIAPSFTLLQTIWLASTGDGLAKPPQRVGL